MIDHIGITVSDYNKSKAFYTQALGAIGYQLLMEFPEKPADPDHAGFGEAGEPDFWLTKATPEKPAQEPAIHIAFRVPTRT
ncbi:MAG: VOC family protein, partial [Glaciimonas sp.]|nr:VOC family protein [Glaciimonas sp.]